MEVLSPGLGSLWLEEGYGVVGEINISHLSPCLAFDSLSFGKGQVWTDFFKFGKDWVFLGSGSLDMGCFLYKDDGGE